MAGPGKVFGPLVQPPSPYTLIASPDGTVNTDYALLFHQLQNIAYYSTRSGPSTERPISASQARWIGMPFFDITIGKPIFLKTASSNAWVDATGTPV